MLRLDFAIYLPTKKIVEKHRPHNKNYMSIAVSVLTTSHVARNNSIGVRQESNLQSPTAYSSVRYRAF